MLILVCLVVCVTQTCHLQPQINSHLDLPSVFFFGHSTNHKGYKCFDLKSNRFIISCHVVFDEFSFPFVEISTTPMSPYLDLLGDDNTPAFGSRFLHAGSPGSMSPSTSPSTGPALHGPVASTPCVDHMLHCPVTSAASAQLAAPTSQVATSGSGPTELGVPPSGPAASTSHAS
jgi:hypothetical protein